MPDSDYQHSAKSLTGRLFMLEENLDQQPEDGDQEASGHLPRSREDVDWWLRKWGFNAVADHGAPFSEDEVLRLIEVNTRM